MDVVQALSMSLVVCVSVIMDDSKRMCTPTYQSSPAETLKVVEEVDTRGITDESMKFDKFKLRKYPYIAT